ncbi:unnamed protein product [Brachionus calyciflorus]|uniref:Uncharacterized protein n=1 Tax=Brachionus calyciflorus TaxID=104777 RepID=A0A813WCI0_9BILA|nr:unnamed protein product [Brachionus calyciflorus]
MILYIFLFTFLIKYSENAIFEDINLINLNIYSKAKELDSKNLTFLMINGDVPSLYSNGNLLDTRFPMTKNTTYEILKEISHLSLSILSQFGKRCDQTLSKEQLDDFNILKGKMFLMYERILTDPLIPNELRLNQIKFLNESIKIVLSTITKKNFDCDDLKNYTLEVKPMLEKNLHAAALSQLLDMKDLMITWIKKYNFLDWNKTYILICNAHMPKEKHIFVQFFNKLFSIETKCDRLVYSETMNDGECINLLKAHITDKILAINLFDDPTRMHKDLMADVAEEIIPKLFSESPINININ